jgi:tetratricopeptide (TPR) repeat protein
LAFEDLHWADPTSLDLLRALADRGAQAPLLLLATTRPEFRAPWSLRSHHSLISLSPLDRAGVARMVGEISAQHALSKDVIEGVSERTGGVPLFVEEVTRLLLERGEQGGVQAIPPTLQQSLAARLDRLGPAREVAQIGAVLGRDFAYTLLRDITDLDEPALQTSLDRLADADLLFVEGVPPQATYRFKHALIQDAAYDSLLKSRRQALHRRAGEILRDEPERGAAEPEVIAHHFTQAGLDDLAIEWWGKAGDQALRRSAFQEAIAHLGKAIAMADKEGENSKRRDRVTAQSRPDIRAKFTQALMITEGHTAAAVQAALDRVDGTSAARLEETEQLTTFYGRWIQATMSGQFPAALAIAEGGLSEGEASNRKALITAAYRWIGLAEFFLGSFAAARGRLEHALTLDDERWSEAHRVATGHDHLVAVHCDLALPLAAQGEVESAARHATLALQRGQKLGQPMSVATAYTIDLIRLWITNRPKDALRVAEALSAIVSAKGIGAWDVSARLYGSWASGRLSNPVAGAKALREAWGQAQQRGARIYDAYASIMLADLAASASNAEEALRCVAEALEIVTAQSFACALAPLHRIRGEALALRDAAGPRRPSRSRSASRASRSRAPSSCRPPCRSPSSINRPADPPKPTPSSPGRSKAFRRRRKCPRSLKRRRCSRRSARARRSSLQRRSASEGCTFKPPTAKQ